MKNTGEEIILLEGPKGTLPIQANDKLGQRMAMLFEIVCLGRKAKEVAGKYTCTPARFSQLRKAFIKDGTEAITPQKTGPKTNYKRTENVVTQVVQYIVLDPAIKVDVIVQKLKQTGFHVSKSTVERIITEQGLQKKTLQISSARQRTKAGGPNPFHQTATKGGSG